MLDEARHPLEVRGPVQAERVGEGNDVHAVALVELVRAPRVAAHPGRLDLGAAGGEDLPRGVDEDEVAAVVADEVLVERPPRRRVLERRLRGAEKDRLHRSTPDTAGSDDLRDEALAWRAHPRRRSSPPGSARRDRGRRLPDRRWPASAAASSKTGPGRSVAVVEVEAALALVRVEIGREEAHRLARAASTRRSRSSSQSPGGR